MITAYFFWATLYLHCVRCSFVFWLYVFVFFVCFFFSFLCLFALFFVYFGTIYIINEIIIMYDLRWYIQRLLRKNAFCTVWGVGIPTRKLKFDHCAITWHRWEIGCNLVLFNYTSYWSNTLEFTPIVCSWSITDTDSILCASEDCAILQSIRNTSMAPTWQFRL